MKPASNEGASATLARWTEEEHRILVQLTEAQVALETKDKSKTLSWSKHWERVSAQLKEHGYNRTPAACGLHWKRNPDSQRATEAAAGPPWTDAEHEILLHLTNEQLAREDADPSTRMSWGDLWDAISIRLGESGFDRPADECDAHWNMVENGRWHPTPKKTLESRPAEASDGIDKEKENHLTGQTHTSPTNGLPNARPWTQAEHDNLVRVFEYKYMPRDSNNPFGEGLWTVISQHHQQGGYNRDWVACLSYSREHEQLQKYLEKSPSLSFKASATTQSAGPTHSASESRVAKVEQDLETVDLSNDKRTASAYVRNTFAETADSDMSEYEPSRPARKQKSTNGRVPADPESPMQKSKPKYSRFTQEQRDFLVTEVEKNGAYIDNDRRLELAQQLGVEENTIKNWFTNYRSKKNRESLTSAPDNPGFSPLNIQASLELGKKRRREALNPTDGTPNNDQQPKRRRLEEEPAVVPMGHEPTISASPAQHSSVSRSISQSERSEASRATPRGTEITSPATPMESPTWQAINSLPSNKRTSQAPTPVVATPQASAAVPTSLPTPEAETDESRKASAAREVQRFEAEIEVLNRIKSDSLQKINNVDQKIEGLDREKDDLQGAKLQEISRMLAEIEAKYKREHDRLSGEQESLKDSKDAELKAVDRSTLKITQKQKALGHWQGLMEFYDDPENDD